MSLNIKSEEAEGLARALAGTTGETLTRAVTIALRERLERVSSSRSTEAAARATRLLEIGKDSAGRWIDPYATVDHGTLLYDERGLPR